MKPSQRFSLLAVLIVAAAAYFSVLGLLRGTEENLARSSTGALTRALTRVPWALGRGMRIVAGAPGALEERDAMRAELDATLRAAQQLGALSAENARLRTLLAFRNSKIAGRDAVAAEVLTRGGAEGWWETLRISRGERDGVRVGDVVVAPDADRRAALVGRVARVSEREAQVVLLTEANHRVSVCVGDPTGKSSMRGIVQGGGPAAHGELAPIVLAAAPLEGLYFHRDSVIPAGILVYTNGLGGLYPAGLVVGRVTSAAIDDSNLFVRVEIAPALDVAALREVVVLMMPAEEERRAESEERSILSPKEEAQ